MDRDLYAKMRDILANLYPERESIKRVCDDSGIDSITIEIDSTPQNNWHKVLQEAEKLDVVASLLAVVWTRYKKNPKFQAVYREYRESVKLDPNAYDFSEQAINKATAPQEDGSPLEKPPLLLTKWFFEELEPPEQSLLLSVALFQEMSRHKITEIAATIEEILS